MTKLRDSPAVAVRMMAPTLELKSSMVATVIATVRLSILRHSALMVASSLSTVDTSSKTPRTAVTPVATAMKSELRLTRVTLEATSSALSDMSTPARLRVTVVVVMMMTVATVVVVTMKAATVVVVAATADKRRAAMAETVVTVAKRAATVATVAMDVKRRAATAAKSKAAMVEVMEEVMNAAMRAATVVAAVATSVVKRAGMAAAAVAMSVERRAAVTVAVRRVDMGVTTTDAETKEAMAEALLMSIFARAREAMDVSAVAATNMAIMAMVVTDVGKLLNYSTVGKALCEGSSNHA